MAFLRLNIASVMTSHLLFVPGEAAIFLASTSMLAQVLELLEHTTQAKNNVPIIYCVFRGIRVSLSPSSYCCPQSYLRSCFLTVM